VCTDISSVLFHPQEFMAVSCSDIDFKVWVPSSHKKSSSLSWRCRSVGSYRQKPILAAAFSPDGSLLAVAASDLLTLWDPSTNGLIRVLSNSPQSLPINHLAFVNQSNCLVTATSGDRPLLTVWDLKTLSVQWSQQIHVEALTVDPARPNFSVLAGVPSISKTKGAFFCPFCNLAGFVQSNKLLGLTF
jgi:NET1-associated nuclear protein 1 (U3 small nucleolar RNA-associated protein 17)